MATKKVKATYDQDSKRYHRFVIDEGQEIVGNLYVPKQGEVPDILEVELVTKKASEAE